MVSYIIVSEIALCTLWLGLTQGSKYTEACVLPQIFIYDLKRNEKKLV